MSTVTKINLKLDDEPAKLVSLRQLYNKYGLPFKAYRVDTCKIVTLVKQETPNDNKCVICGVSVINVNKPGFFDNTELTGPSCVSCPRKFNAWDPDKLAWLEI